MKLSEEVRATIAGPGPCKGQLESWVDAIIDLEVGQMKMDENSNPEWKQLLRGISAGRKALDMITMLEAQLVECQQMIERARTYKGIEGYACPLCEYKEGKFVKYCEPHRQLAECQQERGSNRGG